MALSAERDAEWKAVEEAERKNLPQTVSKLLRPIEEAALKEEKWGEAGKALVMRLLAESQVTQDSAAAAESLEAEIESAPEVLRPILRLVSAHWLYHHYQQNFWIYVQRNHAGEAEGDTIEEWSLPRILNELDDRLQAALADEEMLKTLPASTLDGLLVAGDLGDRLRPTLYDFIAHQAADFYGMEVSVAAQVVNAFELNEGSPVFADVATFLAWSPETGESPKGKALRIYQDLLRFHQEDEDPAAFLHCQLERLVWARGAAQGDAFTEDYKSALWDFIAENGEHPVSAKAREILAQLLKGNEQTKEAYALASAGQKLFPEHPYGKQCGNLVAELEAKSLRLKTESQWTPAPEQLVVESKNLNHLWFRLYRQPFELGEATLRADPLPQRVPLRQLLADKPEQAWDVAIHDAGDYQEMTTYLPAPADLAPGYYVVVASGKEDFTTDDNALAVSGVHVTSIAVVTRRRPAGGLDGYVVDAVTGAPLSDIEMEACWMNGDRSDLIVKQIESDESGFFALPEVNQSCLIVARRGDERAVTRGWASNGSYSNKEREQLIFFTDRAIYRPGQTIHFKAIACRYHTGKARYGVIPDEEFTVILVNGNGEEVGTLDLKTNDRGSLSGSFIAPKAGVLGRYSIRSHEMSGMGTIAIEEYKRPKFFAELGSVSNEASLGQKVKVQARAEAYTGAAVDGAKVSWKVTRTIRWPSWRYWTGHQNGAGQTEEIAYGTGETDASGHFDIEFIAKPDKSVDPKSEPVFNYQVQVDITDSAGETRSATNLVSLAYTTMRASLEVPKWTTVEDAVEITVRTESYDGEPRPAEGRVMIHRLKEPEICPRPNYVPQEEGSDPVSSDPGAGSHSPNETTRWELGELVASLDFDTPAEGEQAGKAKLKSQLDAGRYRLVLTSKDTGGKEVKAIHEIEVVDPAGTDFPTMIPFYTSSPRQVVEPGETFHLFWGSGHAEAQAVIEVYQDNRLLKREWTKPGQTQQMLQFEVTEAQRGGFSVLIQQVANNRFEEETLSIVVPWTNKDLKVRWEHMVNKLEPGAKESWTAIIEGPDGEAAVAEMVATLYDASLDEFVPHQFRGFQSMLRGPGGIWMGSRYSSDLERFRFLYNFERPSRHRLNQLYRDFYYGSRFEGSRSRGRIMSKSALGADFADADPFSAERDASGLLSPLGDPFASGTISSGLRSGDFAVREDSIDEILNNPEGKDEEGVPAVPVRTNLSETAFFYPNLVSGEDGKVRITFTMPEALTTWRFLSLAHDNDLRSGMLNAEVVTSKDLMAQPNPPRFLREGDELEFTVKVTNQSTEPQEGIAKLFLSDAATEESRNDALGVNELERAFTIPAKESRTVSWRLKVPDGQEFLRYRAIAETETLSDGEEGWLPVLPRRVMVTESMALPIRDAGEKKFEFTKLLDSGQSDTLESRFLHLQVVSQPAWYAVMALPYLMEFPHECAEQTFNRYYANALAGHITASDPKIRRIFDLWKGTDALESPLMKNEDLKGLLIEETPWLAEAQDESEARRRVGLLFEENKLSFELEKALEKVKAMQGADGLWPWFPGGRGSEYISLYITTGFGRLRHLGVETDITPALQSLAALDADMTSHYEKLRRDEKLEEANLTRRIAHHLYSRTFFLKDKKLEAKDQLAFDYFVGQAKEHWTDLGNRLSRAHVALALHRLGETETAKLITRSLREHAIVDEEQGMYWNDPRGWWWWQAPIETQAMMIEAFGEIDDDAEAVENCQVWLIKQKQVSDWETTKATADAVYSLLMGGGNLLGSDDLLAVSLGGETIEPGKVEPGTGMYEERITGESVRPDLGKVVLSKKDDGVAWASLHWQYLEDIGEVTSAAGKELQLEKKLFIKVNTDQGEELQPLSGPVEVGDELVTRLVLRNDRAMEFVHLKDQRGSGTEPMNVLSGYRWQDGFGYYETTRDTASHFFIDYLPAGTHVFETSVRVQHRGAYETGMAEIRCMYAPEFSAHSESVKVEVD